MYFDKAVNREIMQSQAFLCDSNDVNKILKIVFPTPAPKKQLPYLFFCCEKNSLKICKDKYKFIKFLFRCDIGWIRKLYHKNLLEASKP